MKTTLPVKENKSHFSGDFLTQSHLNNLYLHLPL
jgi:hypothetical protein